MDSSEPFLREFVCGPFETNAFLVGADDRDEAVLIDTPPLCYDQIQAELKASGRKLSAIFITHPHLDHIFDISRFADDGISILAVQDAIEEIDNPSEIVGMPLDKIKGAPVGRIIRHGEELDYAGLQFQVLEVPGHCIGSVAFYVPHYGICFAGDVLFRGSIGRVDLPGGDFKQLQGSIQNLLYKLNDDTVIYPGHGPETTLGFEKKSNPYVRA